MQLWQSTHRQSISRRSICGEETGQWSAIQHSTLSILWYDLIWLYSSDWNILRYVLSSSVYCMYVENYVWRQLILHNATQSEDMGLHVAQWPVSEKLLSWGASSFLHGMDVSQRNIPNVFDLASLGYGTASLNSETWFCLAIIRFIDYESRWARLAENKKDPICHLYTKNQIISGTNSLTDSVQKKKYWCLSTDSLIL